MKENLFKFIRATKQPSVIKFLDWYNETKDDKFNLDNRQVIKTIIKNNNYRLVDVINDGDGIFYNKFKIKTSNHQLLQFCDMYSIDIFDILNSDVDKIKMYQPLKVDNSKHLVTAFIQLTDEQIFELLEDFCQELELSYGNLSIELGLSHNYLYKVKQNKKIPNRLIDCLSLRFNLRGALFKEFFDYCNFKGWVDKSEFIKDPRFLKYYNYSSTNKEAIDWDELSESISKLAGYIVNLRDHTVIAEQAGAEDLKEWQGKTPIFRVAVNYNLVPKVWKDDIVEFLPHDKFVSSGIYLINEGEEESLCHIMEVVSNDRKHYFVSKRIDNAAFYTLKEFKKIKIVGVCSYIFRKNNN
ncbi:hypothetical protein CKF54_00385 [Psittacicella hinzii]|uniref:Uncharacterized protein n=1 Tax=Psittacicella hinzii TaxID=2028575 RepID=A0A3A1YED8_9GAMM|nr:hypothetical protein [Psittacicella hinzii]RIY34487.1 hypothetical protein CKF54_00385 [Psittacicella hinzii]